MFSKKRLIGLFVLFFGIVAVAYFSGVRVKVLVTRTSETSTPRLELIVGGTTPYWQSVILGARKGAEDHAAELNVRIPQQDGKDQTRLLVMIKPDSVDGVAISPLFPDDQTRILSALASDTNVVTYGNDVPESLRQYYIGTDNHSVGSLAAELVREAIPDGGEVALFIGDGHRDVARLRLHSFYNDLLGTGAGIETLDKPIAKSGTSDKYTILETYFDDRDTDKAEENARQAVAAFPDLKCMVSFYGYNGPACLKALEATGRVGEIKIVAFDAYEATLNGIEAGNVFASVVQDSFKYGYESVRILAALHRGEIDKAPPIAQRSTLTLPCFILKKDNLSEYRKQLSDRLKRVEQQDTGRQSDGV